ncbi:tRNA modification GTPase TrmE [Prevotella sp. DNF00663]|uniref:tRNA uridine-5-carboxymethylaminomethyl(34) synthesis GTPase MnmE n=1 Tax=unclassified Prevotella TaxID=2638335 RepID=UPI0005137DCB|nr:MULTISPECIES: tRNA uridine-5-carboxymethylaminomethyl(34) synthesis GTPase MnmE [unclassified Prevotella]KGI60244.1 tRNA modification GTPase TrmE [Prevotella sp. S7 MS 2]KXB82252.1 tRNA modification GTPase TrmE [Prevotella sp. DNF00663]
MNQEILNPLSDHSTICALATPPGGAIGVIRLSGPDAITITQTLFRSHTGKSLSSAKANTIHYGEIIDNEGKTIDDVLVSIFRAPHSYTGEDSVEISCHGSRYILQTVLTLLSSNGCRPAQPGEYTQRAFLNGKMDLSQAEAVADLVSASNAASHKLAISQLKGNFSSKLQILREQLLKMTSLIELELDFSDQDVDFANRNELLQLAKDIDTHITALARSFKAGLAIKQGIPVAIIGKTNVGKSTLLNRLLHEDKAIVSDIHGTTRDVIEDTVDIHGITFRFIDTAGIRQTRDTVEQLGIKRTYQKLEESSIIIWLFDQQPSEEELQSIYTQTERKKLILVHNKVDLSPTVNVRNAIHISAKQGNNIEQLENELYKAAGIPEITENDVIVTNARHYEALTMAHESINRVINNLEENVSGDLLSEDLRICLDQLADITGGQITTNEVLGTIFSHFCIGK